MKKIIIITISIIICVIGITSGLIKAKLKTLTLNENVINSENIDSSNEDIEMIKEKTLDLYGTYNQNDLLITDKNISHDSFSRPIQIKQIGGLKNKKIENKINESIEKKILLEIDNFLKEYELPYNELYVHNYSNFSNVISFSCVISARDDNYHYEHKSFGLNYNLIDGEEIKFKDLFTKDADIQTIVRDALYKKIEENDEPFWDEKTNKWMEYSWHSDGETGECIEEIVDYVPYLTENEINKIVKRFVNGKENNFYFSNAEICIIEPEYCSVKFEEFADMVTIYDKYVTNESIYENDNIGFKNILTCSRELLISDNFLYKKTSYETDNFFYDITIDKGYYDENNEVEKIVLKKLDDVIKETEIKVEEYRKLAENNPDKMYVVLFNPTITMGKTRFYPSEEYEFYNLISLNYKIKVISDDIKNKNDLLDRILGTYRYPNLGMYGSIYGGINYIAYDGYYIDENLIEEIRETEVYDALFGNEINHLSEIFKEGVDYKQVLKNIFKERYEVKYYYDNGIRIARSEEEIDEMFANTDYKFNATEIYTTFDEYNNMYSSISISDSKLWPYLNLKKLEFYILPNSNQVKLIKEDIQDMSKETLNKAYNEIFARHGHDFKNKELKEYFEKMIWYEPIENKIVTFEELNEIERENANLIKTVISEK